MASGHNQYIGGLWPQKSVFTSRNDYVICEQTPVLQTFKQIHTRIVVKELARVECAHICALSLTFDIVYGVPKDEKKLVRSSGLWSFSAQGSKQICCIIKLTKKSKNVRIANDTTLKGFLGSRNPMEKLFW